MRIKCFAFEAILPSPEFAQLKRFNRTLNNQTFWPKNTANINSTDTTWCALQKLSKQTTLSICHDVEQIQNGRVEAIKKEGSFAALKPGKKTTIWMNFILVHCCHTQWKDRIEVWQANFLPGICVSAIQFGGWSGIHMHNNAAADARMTNEHPRGSSNTICITR